MTENPLVSIIIVNYCGLDLLSKCLKSITTTSYDNFETILVDNNSTDDSVNFTQKNFSDVQIIKLNKNYGFATPNNIGAKVAKGKYLVFLNNDTTITSSWLSELVKVMESDKKIVIAQSLLKHEDGTIDSSGDFIDTTGRAFSSRKIPKTVSNILSARGACMITRKDAFLDMGGFDENYFVSFEDVELGWKAWLWGYKVVVVPNSIVYHLGGQTIQQIPKTIAFHGVKNSVSLRLTNLDNWDAAKSILFLSTAVFLKKVFKISIVKDMEQKYNIPDFTTVFKAGVWILKNFGTIRKKRKILYSRKIRSNKDLKRLGLITKASD